VNGKGEEEGERPPLPKEGLAKAGENFFNEKWKKEWRRGSGEQESAGPERSWEIMALFQRQTRKRGSSGDRLGARGGKPGKASET